MVPCFSAVVLIQSLCAHAASTGVMLQVGSFANVADAEAASARFNTALLGVGVYVRSADLGAKGVWYRVLVGPFADRAAADRACVSLKAAGVTCVPAPADAADAYSPRPTATAPGPRTDTTDGAGSRVALDETPPLRWYREAAQRETGASPLRTATPCRRLACCDQNCD
jgi:hypothetical protein